MHDIPLQKSISLDRGIDIFNHLQNIVDCSASECSIWTEDELEEKCSSFERYKSFEDIPGSPSKVRSRRASTGVNHAFSERNLALTVLKESYKGLETDGGSVSPQIKKLQKCFTFAGALDSVKDDTTGMVEEEQVNKNSMSLKVLIQNDSCSSCPVSPDIQRLKKFNFRNSIDDVVSSDDDDQNLDIREPFYRTIMVEDGKARRLRRSGLQAIARDSLRKGVLVKQEFKSSENLVKRRRSLEFAGSSSERFNITMSEKDIRTNTCNLQKSMLSITRNHQKLVPEIIISHADSDLNASVAKSNTSNSVEISRNCDCRICTDGDRGCFIRKAMSKLFVKIVSCRDFSRKIYWDENNNLNENEMYNCIMQILKLMLGLWLRHLDHN